MKKVIFLILPFAISMSLFAQKKQTYVGFNIGMPPTLAASTVVSAEFKSLANRVLAADEEDCTPPPNCGGLIDPWTCECIPDIRDPWEVKSVAARMQSAIMFETAISKGEGKSLLTRQHYTAANRKYPGKSLKAIVQRMNYYSAAVK
ncbi:MAG: hypothetical protein AAF587_29225 [Bacteroidota bacterium]